MGLAPLHTWLPDAHSEAPSVVSALLSGAVLNCAFLGLLRVQQVCVAAGLASYTRDIWIALGITSLVVSAIFIIGQTDYKRLLAYSSVERWHPGVGRRSGRRGRFWRDASRGEPFSCQSDAVPAGRKHCGAIPDEKHFAGARALDGCAGDGGVLGGGFLAITGTPPFGPFLSKFTILKASLARSCLAYAGFSGNARGHFCGHGNGISGHGPRGTWKASRRAGTRAEVADFTANNIGTGSVVAGSEVPGTLSGLLWKIAHTLGGAA